MEITAEILNMSIGDIMDNSRSKLAEENREYQEAYREFLRQEKKYISLNLPEKVEEIVEELIAKKDLVSSNYADISYIAGVLDAVKLLQELGVLGKTTKNA